VLYEGFAPHKVPVIVECLTDNRNRTAPEIRHLFKEGQLGQPGSMSFFFDRLGVVEATHSDAKRDPESDAIEAGAQNLEPLDGEEIPEGHVGTRFLSEVKDLATVSNWLSKAGWKVLASEIRYVAKNPVELGDADKQQVSAFLNDIDDHDDVHRLYVAMK
jgi:transcriptional/translational regulatory protein YebC/TACO1